MPQNAIRSRSTSPYLGLKAQRRRKTSKEERICPVCAQAFKKAEHLARHLRSHTKERPFNCPVCHKAFARQDTLLRHSRSHPANNEDFEVSEMNCEPVGGGHGRDMSDEPLIAQPPFALTVSGQMESESMVGNMIPPVSPPNSASIGSQTLNLSAPDNSIYNSQMASLTPSLFLEAGEDWDGRSQLALRDHQLDRDWETLLTGEYFDLNAVNMSLYATSEPFPTIDTLPKISTTRPHPISNLDEQLNQRQRASSVQRKWHTSSELTSFSGKMTPDLSQEGNDINESYRERLAEHLQQPVQYGVLPSTAFLGLCIQAYFSNFHPLFPVVHMPTFRPGTQNSILLLSISSIGSLFIGSTRALAHGISMFERLNKAILASLQWDTYVSKSGCSSTIALQASLIGQTFGLLMGRPKDLFGIEVFHGSVIAWARKAKLFHLRHSDCNILDLDGNALQDAWVSWVKTEVNLRIVLSLHIHDAELARFHHHEPLLRHSLDRLPQISSSELFAASSASDWKALLAETQLQNLARSTWPQQSSANTQSQFQSQPCSNPPLAPGDFALSGMLESISALSSDDNTTTAECRNLLTTWYADYAPETQSKPSWLNLLILWHSIFITLHADFNAIESACGRDGYDAAQKHIPYARSWARSLDAKRCVLHAMLIQKNFESLPVGAEPAIHVPLCLYHCGLVWACFMCFSDDFEPVTVDATDNLQFGELQLDGVDGIGILLGQAGALLPRRLATGSLFRIIDLLQKISHWRISQSLASTLLTLVEETQDLF
ncbi:hypothetical protein N7517_008118 [Penicillium concentricum]|uniref:C2H2-type domain-containing protein n=1 Tax=Penicillium concentricum TaxID=293559 RepID=A0A9W9V1D1_9EURO|nr:uncharacterized protein N7517_008118 [Penicillium concentricum]KAJ5365232.1 hypothetical protein N7517_008118 [Penicillium concentricum]